MSAIVEKLERRYRETRSLLCIGLDSDYKKIPDRFKTEQYPQFAFNKWIIDQTHAQALAYKPNTAFYEARGWQGMQELEMTIQYLREKYPDIVTICDAKRGDIGSTNQGYVEAYFDQMGFDSITVNPFVGREGLLPFLDRADKGVIILCHTSNEGAVDVQELSLQEDEELWLYLAKLISQEWNKNQNCMLVMGATYPDQLKVVRETVGEMWLLVPGVGAQGASLEQVLEKGLDANGKGVIINSSRAIIFADDPGAESSKFCEQVNQFREKS